MRTLQEIIDAGYADNKLGKLTVNLVALSAFDAGRDVGRDEVTDKIKAALAKISKSKFKLASKDAVTKILTDIINTTETTIASERLTEIYYDL